MFWDCMDYIANETPHDGGFSLWFESDMIPVAEDWIDRISDDWYAKSPAPVLMGCWVPKVTKRRFFRRPRLWIPEHINGGACYSKDFGQVIPNQAREGVFDLSVFESAQEIGRAYGTPTIGFATVDRAEHEISKPERVLLHGFMEDKDKFIETCINLSSKPIAEFQLPSPLAENVDHVYRSLKLRFVTRGKRAMLNALQLQQDVDESKVRRAA